MRAAVFHGPLDLRIEERPDPVAGPEDLVLRVSVTGVCGTDAAEYRHGPHLYWTADAAHPHSGHRGPVVPGHELVGRVESVGRKAAGFRAGDLVASGAGVGCGRCQPCRAGRTNLCERYWTVGLQRDGGLAELVAVPASTCVQVDPFGLTEDAAGLAQPMAIAAHAIDRAAIRAGDDVLVVGIGGIGAFVVWAADRSGARVLAMDPEVPRQALAAKLGAVEVMPALDERGIVPAADVVLEVSGTPAGLRAALRSVRRGGRVVLVGLQVPPSELDLRAVALNEVELIGTVAHRCAIDLPVALRLLADRSTGWADIAATAIPLEKVVEEGLDPLWNRTSTQIKTLIDPRIGVARPTVMTHPAAMAAG